VHHSSVSAAQGAFSLSAMNLRCPARHTSMERFANVASH
jgi:hypothetical protein